MSVICEPPKLANLEIAEKAVTKARAAIFLSYGFFGHILAKHNITFTDKVDTLAVDGNRNIKVNPSFIAEFKDDNKKIQWALCHEVMHPVLMHLTRRGNRNPKMWNYAGDAVINSLLFESKVGSPIPGTVNMVGAFAFTTDDIYKRLEQNPPAPPPPPPGTGPGPGSGSDPYDNGLGEDLIETTMTDEQMRVAEMQARVDLAEASANAKVRGQFSSELEQFVGRILESDIPWFDKLHEYMQGLQAADYTWTRPNRRFISQGHYLPSTGSVPKMGTVVIQRDISGSVSEVEAAHFNGHVKRLLEECNPQTIHILYTDTKVKRHTQFDDASEVEFETFRAGGTDMEEGFKFCIDNSIEPELFICLTDGETQYTKAPPFPVVWCVSTDIVPPYGMCIPFKVKR
jgi:predicted metal-dependent peptidase